MGTDFLPKNTYSVPPPLCKPSMKMTWEIFHKKGPNTVHQKGLSSACNDFSSEIPYCGEAACAQRERIQRRAEGDLHVRVQPDRPRLREEDP